MPHVRSLLATRECSHEDEVYWAVEVVERPEMGAHEHMLLSQLRPDFSPLLALNHAGHVSP